MLTRSLKVVLLLLILTFLSSLPGGAQQRLPNSQIEERLSYLIYVPNFSTSKPLNQQDLMKLVLELGHWGAFPEKYRGKEKVTGADGYITRSMARQFVHQVVGQDLQVWTAEGHYMSDRLIDDKLTWVYNTNNSMYERPYVRIVDRQDTKGRHIVIQFNVFYNENNISLHIPAKRTGSGTATIEPINGNWIVSSWQVKSLVVPTTKPNLTKRPISSKRATLTVEAKLAVGNKVARQLVTLIKNKDWKAISMLWGGKQQENAEFISECKRLQKKFATIRYEISAIPGNSKTVWIVLAAWPSSLQVDLTTSKIVSVGFGED